jgi:hypothetical protein
VTFEAPRLASGRSHDSDPVPPSEVLESIGDAAAAYDRLTACGVRLHFHLDDRHADLTVVAYDEHSAVLGCLTASDVVELACRGTRA